MKSNEIKGIKIGFSCSEEWSKMDKIGQDRHCRSCDKMVVDFSSLSNEQILRYFKNRKGVKTCGRFEKNQLKNLNQELVSSAQSHYSDTFKPLVLAAAITTTVACSSTKESSYNYIQHESKYEVISKIEHKDSLNTNLLKGKIMDMEKYALIGANVYIPELNAGVASDIDGAFELELPKSDSDSLSVFFSYTGFSSISVDVVDIKNNEIEVTLAEGQLLGSVTIIYPLHIRLWHKVRNVFR